jgi:hypothetical protein
VQHYWKNVVDLGAEKRKLSAKEEKRQGEKKERA